MPDEVTRWGKTYAWWLLHPAIDSDRFCLLAALSTYADDGGYCDPSQATLARHLGRSRPWVNKIIASLTEAGFLEKTVRTRRNGGTTSCLYRLASAAPAADPVAEVTAQRRDSDSPRHRRDTSQPIPEQIKNTRPVGHPDATSPIGGENISRRPPSARAAEVEDVPAGWSPSETALAEAARLVPGADLQAHAAMFASRCRAKGYRYVAGRLDDAWLAWFAEDAQRGARGLGGSARTPRPDGVARAAAWAASAAAPPMRTQAWS